MPGGGSKPGERRGGRQKGTPNKPRADFRAMLEKACKAQKVDLVGVVVAELHNEVPETRLKAARILMDYAYPKPKSVEISGEVSLGTALLDALKRGV